jgi:hypothetical protein
MPQNRPMTSRSPILARAAVLSVLLAAVGCAGPAGTGGTAAPATPPPAPSAATPSAATAGDASVAWADDVCAALTPLATVGQSFSELQPTDRADVVRLLDATGDAVERSRAGLDGVGPSPVRGGDDAVAALKTALDRTSTAVADAKTKLAANDASGLLEAFGAVATGLGSLERFDDQQANPELEAAFRAAPRCQAISAGR